MVVIQFALLAVLIITEGDCFFNIKDTIDPNLSDDGYLDTVALAKRYGYRCEEHFVTTSDGYILKMHRLNGKIKGPVIPNSAPTVLLLHGIIAADTGFILDGPNAHGGILSDYGFDVWMGNFRGNRYSKNHTTLSISSSDFWNFNLNDMSLIDTSAFVDYILEHVKKPSLHAIANSQGGFLLTMLLAYKPEYNAKVKSFTYLASAIYPGIIRSSFIRMIVDFTEKNSKHDFIQSMSMELLKYSDESVRAAYSLCNRNSLLFSMCRNFVGEMFGQNENSSDLDRFPYYIAQGSNGASVTQLAHMSQVFTNHRIELFDYGLEKNMQKYGQSTPPRANFSLITTPKLFFYGTEDTLVPEEYVLASLQMTVNVKKVVRVDSYTHFNFIHAYSIKSELSEVIKDFIITHD